MSYSQNRKSILTIMLITVIVASIGMMVADRRNVQTYPPNAGEILPKEVIAGDPVLLTFRAQRWRDCPGTVHRSFHFDHGYVYPMPTRIASLDGQVTYDRRDRWPRNITVVREMMIPRFLPLGDVEYRSEQRFYCNLIHQIFDWPIVHHLPPVRFKVVSAFQ